MNDFSQLDALLKRVKVFAQSAIPVAAEVARLNILERTAQGQDADNKTFTKWGSAHSGKMTRANREFSSMGIHNDSNVYSPAQEKKRVTGGYRIDLKDIRETGGTLDSIALRNESGSKAPKAGTQLATSEKFMPIMVGQMQHPKWPYHHNVLGVNSGDLEGMKSAIVLKWGEVVLQ